MVDAEAKGIFVRERAARSIATIRESEDGMPSSTERCFM